MRPILTILCAVVLCSACEKDQHEEIRKFLSFETDSSIVIAENPSAIVTRANLTDTDPNNDLDKLTITANSDTNDEVTITLIGSSEGLSKGIFQSQDGNSFALLYKNRNLAQVANQTLGTFTLEITNVQDSLIEGSFYGTLVDTTGTMSPRNARYGFIRTVVKAN
ncbi:hypothetical protein [Chitinophaga rhizophila]|uniref:Uncharacterized protein n=1 Tax=Chitinophaga rhizophila TaxID=2866212 RepID=A0ABS7GDY0_9BACT|nr:hypothetical protein [Chitinophaga rhizophila]MBW8685626.1 hypothetical protein [Chitinophaga rhizophila]